MTLKTTKLRDAITFALAVGATALTGTGIAFAQDTPATTDEEATELDRITVTGSRIRAVDAETTAPVLVLTRAQIEATGLTSVGDVLFNITASDGGALRNITTSTNGSDGTQNISLRGLGAQRTLVLVNGRRWITQGDGTVDLNTIPISVVERIEVLKDGASAIYGSDAIAGVINVITRKNFEGGEARAYLGIYSKGDGFQEAYDFTLGSNSDRINTVFSVSYTDQDPVFAGDREISSVPLSGAGNLASGGAFGSGSTAYGRFRGTGLPGGSNQTLIPGRPGTSPTDFRRFISYTTDGSGSSDRYNFAPINYLLQPIERFNMYGQGTLRLTDEINANIQATYVKRTSTQQLAEVPATMDTTGANGPQWRFAPTAGNVFNPFGRDLTGAFFRNVAVGPRTNHFDNNNLAVTGWLDGSFEAWGRDLFWDAGYSYLDSRFSSRGENYLNLFNLRRAVGDSQRNPVTGELECLDQLGGVIVGCTPYNVFGGPDLGLAAGLITPEEYRRMIDYVSYTLVEAQQNQTQDYFANLAGDLFDLPAGPLGFAVGLEHRRTKFFNQPDALVAGGGSSNNFQEATNGSVNSDEAYIELNVPLLADVPFAKLLEINLAARHSKYDSSGFFGGTNVEPDIGSDTSRKFGIKWQVFDDLLFRGTWSESFRAPSVTNLFAGGSENFPQANDPCNTTSFPDLGADAQARCLAQGVPAGGAPQDNRQIRSLVGGNPFLKPEFGTTKTLGVVYSPSFVTGLDFTLDWYNIELEDVISGRSLNTILNECIVNGDPLFCSFFDRDGTGQVTNARQTSFNIDNGEVEGYDFSVKYRMPETRWGKFGFQWDNTYQVENTLFGTVGEYNGSPTWRLRSNLTTTWQMGDFDATYSARYYSDLDEDCSGYFGLFEYGITPQQLCSGASDAAVDADGNLVVENHLGAVTYHDLQFGWKTPWNGKVSLGGRNIFGKEPPRTNLSFAHSFDGAYDLPGGGFYYIQYSQKF